MKNTTAVYTCGILTLSDKGAKGEREDTSGPLLQHLVTEQGFNVTTYQIIPDQPLLIEEVLTNWVDEKKIDLILTTGGTGVSPSDRTPEATRRVIDMEIPGIAEAMRQASLAKTPNAIWSRGIAGIRGESLIINLPGSEKGAKENIQVILPALAHGLYKIKGGTADCGEKKTERINSPQAR
ncbi:MAG: MogA/MoaB family molybdenum cofactor biosynthesis protein [Candidatus Electrothrix sp. ATG1]|nr:MogA/MoaB family molybdenum cofactor biosynthesis protein [Candidatus Electrothrix sp. ATG1]